MNDKKKIISKNFLQNINHKTINNKINDDYLVSVVMPSFNQDKYIEKSILSVINQNYNNIELIIIDGGSTDKTISIIKKYEKYVNYWISEKDYGQSDALNKGFKISNGEILCWLNSDDLLLPDAIKTAVKLLSNNLEKKICYGDWVTIDEHDSIIDKFFAFDFNKYHFIYEGFHLNSQAMFWRREVLKNFSGFDINLNKTMDYQMILEFSLKNKETNFIRVAKYLAAFRRYSGQKTSGYDEDVHNEHLYISKKYALDDRFSQIGKLKRIYFRFRRAKWYFKRGGFKELFKRLIIMRENIGK